MAVTAPKCRLCGKKHWANEPHDFAEVVSVGDNVATKKQKAATEPANVATIREIGVRELNRGISAQLRDLPFKITKNGKVIAVVRER